MPIITAFNSKGGAGKSTLLAILASVLVDNNLGVSIIDTDPQQTLAEWGTKTGHPLIHAVSETRTSNIHSVMREEAIRNPFIIIDTAGFETDIRTPILSRADIVLIPLQASPADAERAASTMAYITADEETIGRPIQRRLVYTRINAAITTRVQRSIEEEVSANDVPSLNNRLVDREAYKAMLYGELLTALDPTKVNGVGAAIQNGKELCVEVLNLIVPQKQQSSASISAA